MRWYDVTRKYRVLCADDDLLDYANTLQMAKLIAGEWQTRIDRYVQIIRQKGIPRRWKATLEPSGRVRLDVLYSDGEPDDPMEHAARRAAALAKHIDRQRRRRRKRRSERQKQEAQVQKARAEQFGSANKRGVVCLDTQPPRAFGSVEQAAAWAGVRRKTMTAAMKRKCRAGGFRFDYADAILEKCANGTGYEDGIIASAKQAIIWAGRARKSPRRNELPEQHGELPGQTQEATIVPAIDGAGAVPATQEPIQRCGERPAQPAVEEGGKEECVNR